MSGFLLCDWFAARCLGWRVVGGLLPLGCCVVFDVVHAWRVLRLTCGDGV